MHHPAVEKFIDNITPIFQLSLIALYFPIYHIHVIAGFVYASLFVVGGFFTLKRALLLHNNDSSFILLVVTISTDVFAIIFAFANAYEIFGYVVNLDQTVTGLWQHVYFSVVTFTTVGYGDYLPYGASKIIASIQALLGFGYFAFVIGIVGSMFYARINNITRQ
jgi:hypothetical protein